MISTQAGNSGIAMEDVMRAIMARQAAEGEAAEGSDESDENGFRALDESEEDTEGGHHMIGHPGQT